MRMDRRSHDLRYTLKDRSTGEVFFVVVFTLIPKEDVEKEKEGESKEEKPATKDEPVTADDDVD